MLADRDHQLGEIVARADDARVGRGGIVFVSGESGAGKTSFVETFVDHWVKDERVLWGACDPLPAAWDALNLLTCSPGAVPDRLLTDLGVGLPALRALSDAGLIRRTPRGVASGMTCAGWPSAA